MAFDPQTASLRSPGGAVPVEGRSAADASCSVSGSMNSLQAASEGASDAELLTRAATGEPQAASDLYRRHSRAVYRFAWALSGNDTFAADVVQDTFLSLIDAPAGAPAFDAARGSVAAYLCGIARHLVYRRWRDRHDAVEDIESVAERASEAPVPELPHDRLERIRALRQLHEAIRALPSYYRDVLVLVELQEMSYADAAQVVGIEVGTVRSRLSRAKKQLAACLSPQTAGGSPGEVQ